MTRNIRIAFTEEAHRSVLRHLYPGDNREHAGVLLCGWTRQRDQIHLTVRTFIEARDGTDYTVSPEFHGRLEPLFIDDALSLAQRKGLAYLAIHNHFSTNSVTFSRVDMRSHEYGYPTLLALNQAPVGAAVFGTESVEIDLWMPEGSRHQLAQARVVGTQIKHYWSSPALAPTLRNNSEFDRQLPFLRNLGQGIISTARVAVVGLGGLGSQLIEPLVRLGIRKFVLVDPDRIEHTNYSRLHWALPQDLPRSGAPGQLKVQIAARAIRAICPDAEVQAHPFDIALGNNYSHLLDSDFIFLAADSAEARLTCNAIANQYFIPVTQVGTKINVNTLGRLDGVFGAVRQIRPGRGCLWCNGLIDRARLADAAKSKEQRRNEAYGVQGPNASVVTFNAEVAGRALNEFVALYACPQTERAQERRDYTLMDLISGEREPIEATSLSNCSFCSSDCPTSLLGLADQGVTPSVSIGRRSGELE